MHFCAATKYQNVSEKYTRNSHFQAYKFEFAWKCFAIIPSVRTLHAFRCTVEIVLFSLFGAADVGHQTRCCDESNRSAELYLVWTAHFKNVLKPMLFC